MKLISKRANGTKQVVTINNEPSMTDSQWAPQTDVNQIMARYKKTGQVTHLAKIQGSYADVSSIPDLATALNQVTKAQQTFDLLPAELRSRFGNSPVNMVEFLKDSKNRDEAIKLGLIPKPAPAEKPDGNAQPSTGNKDVVRVSSSTKTPKKTKVESSNDDD